MKAVLKCVVALFVCAVASSVLAEPGAGINVLDCKISPFVDTAVIYDSNVLLNENTADELDDTSYAIGYGVNLDHARKHYVLSAKLWGLSEIYSDLDSLDHNDFGDDISLNFLTPGGFNVRVLQSYSDVQDVDYTTTSIENYVTHIAGVRVSRSVTDKMNANLGYNYKAKDYDADSLFGHSRSKLDGSIDYVLTDMTALLVKAGIESQDGDGNSGEGTVYRASLGAKSRQTSQLTASADVGILGLSSDDADISDFAFGAEVAWQAMDKVGVTLAADKEIEPSSIEKNNYNIITGISAGIGYTLLDNLKVSLNAGYMEVDLQNKYDDSGSLVTKTEDIIFGKVRLDYQSPMKFLKVFATAGITDQDSTISRLDYTREKVSVGVSLVY